MALLGRYPDADAALMAIDSHGIYRIELEDDGAVYAVYIDPPANVIGAPLVSPAPEFEN